MHYSRMWSRQTLLSFIVACHLSSPVGDWGKQIFLKYNQETDGDKLCITKDVFEKVVLK